MLTALVVFWGWRTVTARPERVCGEEKLGELLNVRRLGKKGVGTELIRLGDIGFKIRAREDDRGDDSAIRVPLEPDKELKSVCSRHFEIGHNHFREWVLCPVGEWRGAFEISDGLLTVADVRQGGSQTGRSQGISEKD